MPKNRSSTFKLLTELPWWVLIVVAAITYIALTHILPSVETGNPIINAVFRAFAHAGPVFAIIFLLASPFAYCNARRKRCLLDQQKDLDSIKALSWREFEELVAEAYRRKGYSVAENGFGPDGGIDLLLKKDGETVIVQCKQWRSKNVGVSVVREMFGILTAQAASKVLIICCGGFTIDAIAFAKGKPLQLIGGVELLGIVQDMQVDAADKGELQNANEDMTTNEFACPKCGSELVKRIAKRGVNTGNAFYGCAAFPKCRYTSEA